MTAPQPLAASAADRWTSAAGRVNLLIDLRNRGASLGETPWWAGVRLDCVAAAIPGPRASKRDHAARASPRQAESSVAAGLVLPRDDPRERRGPARDACLRLTWECGSAGALWRALIALGGCVRSRTIASAVMRVVGEDHVDLVASCGGFGCVAVEVPDECDQRLP
jgi:hypothetical protein